MEMRVETELIQRSLQADRKRGFMYHEARAWARLFDRKYIGRTLIGVMMMVFQRKSIIFFYA